MRKPYELAEVASSNERLRRAVAEKIVRAMPIDRRMQIERRLDGKAQLNDDTEVPDTGAQRLPKRGRRRLFGVLFEGAVGGHDEHPYDTRRQHRRVRGRAAMSSRGDGATDRRCAETWHRETK